MTISASNQSISENQLKTFEKFEFHWNYFRFFRESSTLEQDYQRPTWKFQAATKFVSLPSLSSKVANKKSELCRYNETQTITTSPENFSARTCLLLFINRSRAFCFTFIGSVSTGSASTCSTSTTFVYWFTFSSLSGSLWLRTVQTLLEEHRLYAIESRSYRSGIMSEANL